MLLSSYHQKYANLNDEEIKHRANIKEQEILTIINEIQIKIENNPARLAVLGCADKRLISLHKQIFEKVLNRKFEVITFDITINHLGAGPNIYQHDCTLPLPNSPYDITYAHVLLKFIETVKQFDLIKNSFDSLNSGGIAIHIFDREEIQSQEEKLPDGLWSVPLERWKNKLTEFGIEYKEISLKYGPALILFKNN